MPAGQKAGGLGLLPWGPLVRPLSTWSVEPGSQGLSSQREAVKSGEAAPERKHVWPVRTGAAAHAWPARPPAYCAA